MPRHSQHGVLTGPDDLRCHRRQLFHWLGRDLEQDVRKSAADRAEQYYQRLKNSLADGLWLKQPDTPDDLGQNSEFQVTRPICCFTETSVSEIAEHTRAYGRLGLGFPRRFVLTNGGAPVQYCSETSSHPMFAAWLQLRKLLHNPAVSGSLEPAKLQQMQDEFDYVAHFLKRMKQRRKKTRSRPPVNARAAGTGSPAQRRHARNFGDTLPFMEEREWRIVLREKNNRPLPRKAVRNLSGNQPDWFLPYTPCVDLFTVVVPDHRTLDLVLGCSELMQKLRSPTRPPVMVLALPDIGTL